jgi:predicted transcriptional regulator
MKKRKNKKTVFTVKTGTVEEFFNQAKKVMRALDTGEDIEPSYSLVFIDPAEMLHFLSEKKMKLIAVIRKHPGTITGIAKITRRNRTAVYRDIHEMEQFGLVKTREEINPGHGRHKVVELVAPVLKLEAYI